MNVSVGNNVMLMAAPLPAVAAPEEPAADEQPALRAAPVPSESDEHRFLAEVGDTVELNIEGLADGSRRSCTVTKDGSATEDATCNRTEGTVEVSATGVYEVEYSWRECVRWNSSHTTCRQYEDKNYSATIVVYDVAADIEGSVLSEEDMATVAGLVTEQIRALLAAGETYNQYLELISWDGIWSALMDDQHFTVAAVVGEDLYNEAGDAIEAEIKDTEEVAAVYGGYILVYVGNTEVGMVYELDAPVTMALEIPEE